MFGNPWIFQQAQAALEGKPIPLMPPLAERCDAAVRQFELAAANKGEKIACLEARRHYAWYLKGVPYAGLLEERDRPRSRPWRMCTGSRRASSES